MSYATVGKKTKFQRHFVITHTLACSEIELQREIIFVQKLVNLYFTELMYNSLYIIRIFLISKSVTF